MGLGWFATFDGDVPGVDPAATPSKALVHAQHQLANLARSLVVTPLHQFLSNRPDDVASFLQAEGIAAEDYELPEEEWFAVADGLATVQALLARLRGGQDSIINRDKVLADLEKLAQTLRQAQAVGVSFHLSSNMPNE